MEDNIRDLQLVEYEILKAVVDICEKRNIRYYLCAGTLLGAVRHNGFIPWDDDIDIMMPVIDYFKFIEIAQNELGDQYFLQNYLTDPNFEVCYSKVRKNNTTYMDKYHLKWKIHHGVWIDIFPLVPMNSKKVNNRKHLITLSNFIQSWNKIESHREEYVGMIGRSGVMAMYLFSKLPMTIRQRIHTAILKPIFYSGGVKMIA